MGRCEGSARDKPFSRPISSLRYFNANDYLLVNDYLVAGKFNEAFALTDDWWAMSVGRLAP